MEGEIREFVRRDVAGLRQHPEIKTLREKLHDEAERVQREIVEYASLSRAAMQSTKVIAESLSNWKSVPEGPSIDEGA